MIVSLKQREQYNTICMLEKAEKIARQDLLGFRQKYSEPTSEFITKKHNELATHFGTAYEQFQEYKQQLERKYRFKFPLECHTAGDDRLYYASYFKNRFMSNERVVAC